MNPANKTTYIIAAAALVIFAVTIYFLFIFQKGDKVNKDQEVTDEIKQIDEIPQEKRPYVTLTPTTDGAEIILSIENMSAFDDIEYTMTYLADNPEIPGARIERGSTGFDVNTSDEKYKKSILLGTASRGTRSPDRGVTDGVLTFNFTIDETEYISETSWNLLEVGTRPITIEDIDEHLSLEVPALSKNYWVIVADTVGIAPNSPFEASGAILPSIGIFSVAPEFTKSAQLTIEIDSSIQSPTLYSYQGATGTWQELTSTYNSSDSTLSSDVASFATFVVASSQ